jgi:hypothetical protein
VEVQNLIAENPLLDGSAPEILIDDDEVDLSANPDWTKVVKAGAYGRSYLVANKGIVDFTANIIKSGDYMVYTYYHYGENAASELNFTVSNTDKSSNKSFNINKKDVKIEGQAIGGWVELGRFPFEAGTQATVSVKAVKHDGESIADAVLFIPE